MDEATIDLMIEELGNGPGVYLPANIWTKIIPVHMEMLRKYGVDAFKRTVNRHYAQDNIIAFDDHRVHGLVEFLGAAAIGKLPATMTVDGLPVFASTDHALHYCAYVTLLWKACIRLDTLGIRTQVAEPALGQPIYIDFDGRRITQDLAKSVIDANVIAGAFPEVMTGHQLIAEIGPGYGRVAHVFAQIGDYRWAFFDIPPTLHVAQTYFETLFPGEVAPFQRYRSGDEVMRAIEGRRFLFFTVNQLELLPPDLFDLMINIDSFGEMRTDTVRACMGQMSRLVRRGGGIYLRNLDEGCSSVHEDKVFNIPCKSDYTPTGLWDEVLSRPWLLDALYREIAWRRR